jgi:hypothetical protein
MIMSYLAYWYVLDFPAIFVTFGMMEIRPIYVDISNFSSFYLKI